MLPSPASIWTSSGQAAGRLDGKELVYAALYAPLDGMNEKGLAVSVNMIQDAATIAQDTEKPDITTTTAIRLLLNKAATVDEALELLKQYDLHASFGMMIHFAIADNSGRGVAVEYIDNEMVVSETPVVTNFYLAEGDKQGVGHPAVPHPLRHPDQSPGRPRDHDHGRRPGCAGQRQQAQLRRR